MVQAGRRNLVNGRIIGRTRAELWMVEPLTRTGGGKDLLVGFVAGSGGGRRKRSEPTLPARGPCGKTEDKSATVRCGGDGKRGHEPNDVRGN